MRKHNNQVSIPYNLLKAILDTELRISTTRLLIALFAWQDFNDLWSRYDTYVKNPEQARTWAPCKALRDLVGPKSANTAKSLVTMVEQVSQTWLFDDLRLSEDHKTIYWQFSSHVHNWMARRFFEESFALLDLRDVAACRSHLTLSLYCGAKNLRNHPLPEYVIPLSKPWSTHRRGLFTSLQQVSKMVDTTFFVGLEWIYRADRKQQLRIRLRHHGTTWYPDKLRQWGTDARVFKLNSEELREIRNRHFPDYAIPGEAPGSVEKNLRRNLPKT
ncbi:hypothetical protein [Actibacterium lipolyticum]|uniref:Uncharacterized protein n=1 Tax=Actibacterium lipolyticum TaxID=1524263 RepID=A0A238JUY4_9RHOB|nr:hypothetical protein [Actibacterium lipolyticum]SMX34405.1 hypothetical protein COL8621_01293 [Actibacterium lipolyticum]